MNISVIIVNYNTKDLTGDCLKSIFKYTHDVDFEVIVVDNASTDGSQKHIKSNFPQVRLLECEKNLGFGRANNLGAEYATGEFLFLLNSDTLLIENSIKELYHFFIDNENQLKIGVLGTIMVDENLITNGYGNVFPSCQEESKKILKKIPFYNSKESSFVSSSYDFTNLYFEIDYVIGADMFLRKSLFNKMNGFAIEFFMYYEESDLQKRIFDEGFKNYIYTNTRIIHLEEGSGKAIKNYSNRKRIITHRSKITYLKRNDKEHYSKYVVLDFLILLLTFFNFKYTMAENFNYFREIIKSY